MDLFSELNDRLLFAVPKKGRLHEICLQFLKGADIQFHRKPRHDIALVKNHPIALVFLPAADIAKYVGGGRVDLGITGQDIIAETAASYGTATVAHDTNDTSNSSGSLSPTLDSVREVMPLNFGQCRLMVQTPVRSGIENVRDLIGKRIVTSFEALTRQFFTRLEAEALGVTVDTFREQHALKTTVEFVSGSVEAACALGLADGIVDLVESGETMRAAGLQAIDTIVESQAVLIANTRTRFPKLVNMIQSRIEGVIASRKFVYITYNIERDMLPKAKEITPGRQAPTINELVDSHWLAVSAMVLAKDVADVMDQLKTIGARDILVFNISNCRV
ncbi:ATP phosphoribosyltransferase (ATP-PRTase) (ATP-PRT) [Dispira parvispora]|uniref:ATP phosphoribosyltransferase n=1 Tax=Dispira parvispora TaxID=1520584 RepID=A0A9W8ASS0_9FUNG|nr:ATP phosphoribosyltransferase (ATP-PRTase) (ATP-PRT) [Dispira parvispora]